MGTCNATDKESSTELFLVKEEQSTMLHLVPIEFYTQQLYKLSYITNSLDDTQYHQFLKSINVSIEDPIIRDFAKETDSYSAPKLLILGIMYCSGDITNKCKVLWKCITLISKEQPTKVEVANVLDWIIDLSCILIPSSILTRVHK